VINIPNIIIFGWFPPHKGPEIGAVGQKVFEKFPGDETLMKIIVPTTYTSDKEGIFALTVLEPAEGRYGDAMARCADIMYMYQGIEGLRYEIKTFTTTEEVAARAQRMG
jgi:hypothetical protein